MASRIGYSISKNLDIEKFKEWISKHNRVILGYSSLNIPGEPKIIKMSLLVYYGNKNVIITIETNYISEACLVKVRVYDPETNLVQRYYTDLTIEQYLNFIEFLEKL